VENAPKSASKLIAGRASRCLCLHLAYKEVGVDTVEDEDMIIKIGFASGVGE
jgi:hypothetical protein